VAATPGRDYDRRGMDLSPEFDDAEASPVPRARPAAPEVAEPPALAYARPAVRLNPLDLLESKRDAAVDLLFGLLLIGVWQFLIPVLFVAFVDPTGTALESPDIGLGLNLFSGVLIASAACGIHRLRRLPMSSFGFRSDHIWLDAGIAVATTICLLVLNLATRVTSMLLDERAEDAVLESTQNILATIPKMTIGRSCFMALMIGAYEESFFRGFALPRLKRVFGSWPLAVLIASVCFTLLHAYQGIAGMVSVFMISLAFGGVFVWRKSLLPVVIAHFLVDFSGLMVLWFLRWQAEQDPDAFREMFG
jgi:membrane protease YdiL (CAAX protease family)